MTLGADLPLVGSDRFLHRSECGIAVGSGGRLDQAWELYADRFERFTGARLDPQFARLALPPLYEVVPVLPGGTVAIVGTGPSLGASIPLIRRLRGHVSVWTSIRGAEALASHGITPDLAILQHGSDLDAHLTPRHLRDRDGRHPLEEVPTVLVEPRTPVALLAGLDPDRLGLVDAAVGRARPVEVGQATLGDQQGVEHRAGEQPVEQQELDGEPGPRKERRCTGTPWRRIRAGTLRRGQCKTMVSRVEAS